MSDTYQIVFLKAGDGSPSAKKSVAERIAQATKSAPDKILKQIESAPFIYKKGLPKAKADAIAAALNKLGATTEVRAEVVAPAAPAPQPTGAGFDFGSPMGSTPPAAPAPGGFDFGGGASASSAAGGQDFGFGTPAPRPGGEDFSIEQPSGTSGEFGLSSPAPAAAPGSGGFDFGATAPPGAAKPTPRIEVERNTDFASSAPAKEPPRAARKTGETIACPRCGHEQPPAAECASCGVLMSKAGDASPAGAPRRPRVAVTKSSGGSKAMPIAAGAVVLALLVAGAWFLGFLNPIRLKLDAGSNPVLKAAGVTLSPPAGKYVVATLGDSTKAKEIIDNFIARSAHIQAESARLSKLADVAQFDAERATLQGEIDAYIQHPANRIFEAATQVVAPYYSVSGVALEVLGTKYMFTETIALSGATGVEPLLNEVEIRRNLEDARARVAEQEGRRLVEERARAVNVDFNDSFDAGLGERWAPAAEALVQAVGGRLRIGAKPGLAPAGSMVLFPEPVADYVAEITILGSAGDSSRAGLIVFQDAGHYLALVKSRRGRAGDAVQVVTQAGDGYNAPAGGDTRVQIERKGPYYVFSGWDAVRRSWTQLDRLQPAWAGSAPPQIGVVAFNGSAVFELDDFSLVIKK